MLTGLLVMKTRTYPEWEQGCPDSVQGALTYAGL